ncbi:MAG: metallophosphoesterase [Candidatus Caldarchaeum sp.]
MSLQRRQLYKELISTAVSEGFQLTEKALRRLEEHSNPYQALTATIERLKKTRPEAVVIDVDDLQQPVEKPAEPTPPPPQEKPIHIPRLETRSVIDNDYKIEGEIEEFRSYFLSRYHLIKRILSKRRLEFTPVSEVPALRDGGETVVAVMILSRKEGPSNIRITCDDPSGQMEVVASKRNQQIYKHALELLTDTVVAMRIKRLGGVNILTEIIHPDVDEQQLRKTPQTEEAYVCLISDIHVGSRHFRRDYFENFLDWLNRGRDGVVKRLTHLVIGGDLVEGVGIYPGQEKDLLYRNVEEQLREAGKLLAEIPQNIEIIFIPGNHEPVRKALPQPPLHDRHRKLLDEQRKMIHLSNPAELVFDGKRITVYHGQGLDDIIQSLPTASYSTLPENAAEVVTALLRYRHLAPIYGGSAQLLPSKEDRLVIVEQPHLLQTGHIHVLVNTSYRGVRLVNAAAWQDQTDYQKSLGLEPDVGYAAVLNLASMNVEMKSFAS